MTGSKRSHAEEILASLGDRRAAERFSAALGFLRGHLVVKREVFNGRDFLFAGPAAEIRAALKEIVDLEHRVSRFMQFDFVQIDDYFLLRVVGAEKYQTAIDGYFD